MPMSVNNTAAAGAAYADIRVGECQVHQAKFDVSEFSSVDDANGSLAPGLPVRLSSGVVLPITSTSQVAHGLVGPEPIKLGSADHFGNIFLSGNFNQDMIEDNLGRSLSANELAAIAETPAIRLI